MATNILSPPTSGEGDVLSSPQSRRSCAIASSSPWTQIVRGADSDTEIVVAPSSPSATCSSDWPTSKPPAPATSPSSCSAEDESPAEPPQTLTQTDGANAAKKPAWKKPSNGNGNGNNAHAATAAEVTPVMDTASWPALSACTKSSPKPASSDSLKALSEGSVPPLQGIGVASLSPSKAVIGSNTNPNPIPNHVTTSRQRSVKRGSTNGGFIQPSPPPQLQVPGAETTPGKHGNTAGDSASHKEGGQRGGGLTGNHQPQCSNSFNRRGSGGQHPRGDGSYHHNHGGRRDQDRGNQGWNNPHRSFGGRDNHMQPQSGASRSFARGPHTSPAFISPPVAVRPFGNPSVYPEVPPSLMYVPGPPPESLRGVPVMAPAHPLYFPPIPDPQLHAKIMKQIEYYFSNENLIKDTFLRQNMDDQGWVPIKLIAGFKKVMLLTDNIQLILNAIQASTVVEVQNDKIRKRNEWMKWIMPPGPFSPVSSPQSLARSSHDVLAGQFQGIELDENMHAHTEMFSRSSSGDLSSQLQQSGGESTVVAGSERKMLVGSPSK